MTDFLYEYEGSGRRIVVRCGAIGSNVQIGIGRTIEAARRALQPTPTQVQGQEPEDDAIEWAHDTGWFDNEPGLPEFIDVIPDVVIIEFRPEDIEVIDERGTVPGAVVTTPAGEKFRVIPREGDSVECWANVAADWAFFNANAFAKAAERGANGESGTISYDA